MYALCEINQVNSYALEICNPLNLVEKARDKRCSEF